MQSIKRFRSAAVVHAHPGRQDDAPTMARARRRAGRLAGIGALAALVLIGTPAVATSASAVAATAEATNGAAQLYWIDSVPGTIGRANVDGTGAVQNFIQGGAQPYGLAADATHIYWTNVVSSTGAGTIGRANLDGTGVNQNFITGVKPLGGLAVDGGHIYWGNIDDSQAVGEATIGRANLDGTGVDLNFITGAAIVDGIALDTAHIYWTNEDTRAIGRANLDGTGVNQNFVATESFPDAVAVDSGHIYWANIGGFAIGRANLDGTGVNPFFVDAGPYPFGLAVDSGHLYWSHVNLSSDPNAFDDAIGRANLDGTGADQSFIFGALAPAGVTVGPQAADTPPPTDTPPPPPPTDTPPPPTDTPPPTVTPSASVPAAPAIGSATFGNASATVTWTAPSNGGGSTITGYLVRVLDSTGAQVGALHPAGATATSQRVTGLTNGSRYQFQVAAQNAFGTGPNSALSTVVVPATVPSAPVIATAASGTAGGAVTATAHWIAPTTSGGSAVTGYVVRALRISSRGAVLSTRTSAVQPSSARQLTMTLRTGRYRFTVQARNKAGSGPQSASSNKVTAR